MFLGFIPINKHHYHVNTSIEITQLAALLSAGAVLLLKTHVLCMH